MHSRLVVAVVLMAVASVVSAQSRDALALYRAGRFQDAVRITQEEIERTPRNMDSYAVLCWSLLALRQYEEALEWAGRGLAVSRFDHRLVGVVGEAHYNLGNDLEALSSLEEYVAIAPTGTLIPVVYYMMGEIFLRFGELYHADIALTTAVYHSSSNAGWWTRLGFAREQAQAYEAARVAYNRAIQLSPGSTEARRGLDRLPARP